MRVSDVGVICLVMFSRFNDAESMTETPAPESSKTLVKLLSISAFKTTVDIFWP